MAYRMKPSTFKNKIAKEENVLDKEVAITRAAEMEAANKKFNETYGASGKYPKGHPNHIPKASKSYTPKPTQDNF